MDESMNYDKAAEIIKTAILQSQYDAARSVNEKQLALYYGVGKYISQNSRKGFWGKGAIDAISERLDKALPGLRGFTSRNLRYMRTFYEEWEILDFADRSQNTLENESGNLELASSKLPGLPDGRVSAHRVYSSQSNSWKSKKHRRTPILYQALRQ